MGRMTASTRKEPVCRLVGWWVKSRRWAVRERTLDALRHTEAQRGCPAGRTSLMYVRFMVPQVGAGNVPLVMVHGALLPASRGRPRRTAGWAGTNTSCARAIPCTFSTRVGRGRFGFTRPCSTPYAPARRRPPTSPRCFDSAAKSSGRTSASAPRRSSCTQDTNNLQIADLILPWINEKVGASPRRNK